VTTSLSISLPNKHLQHYLLCFTGPPAHEMTAGCSRRTRYTEPQ
jgi:hypothetical protein